MNRILRARNKNTNDLFPQAYCAGCFSIQCSCCGTSNIHCQKCLRSDVYCMSCSKMDSYPLRGYNIKFGKSLVHISDLKICVLCTLNHRI